MEPHTNHQCYYCIVCDHNPNCPFDTEFNRKLNEEIKAFYRVFWIVVAVICTLAALAGFFYVCLCAWSSLPG